MKPRTHTLIAVLIFSAATVAYTHHTPEFSRFFAGHNDFLPRYTQGRLAGTDRMYDVEAGFREQERIAGFHIAYAYHDRFPWQNLLFAPLSRLPYRAAYWLWVGLNLACFAALVRFWLLPRDSNLWGTVYFPAAASLIVGQDALMIAACLMAALLLSHRRRDFAAGLVLALCTAKPHLFLFVPVALAAHRRWRLIAGACLGTAALLAVSTVLAGPGWPVGLLKFMNMLSVDPGPGFMLRPSVFQFGLNPATISAAACLAVLICLAVPRIRSLEGAVGVAVLGGFLVALHTYVYDLPLLLVALPALPLDGRPNWLRIALWTPLPYWALLNGFPYNIAMPLLLAATIAAAAWQESRRLTRKSNPSL